MHRLGQTRKSAVLSAAVAALAASSAPAAEIWSATNGTIRLTWDARILEQHGLSIEVPGAITAPGIDAGVTELPLSEGFETTFAIAGDGLPRLYARDFSAAVELILRTADAEQPVFRFVIGPEAGQNVPLPGDAGFLELRDPKTGLDREGGVFQFASREVVITPRLAGLLGRAELSGVSIGRAEIAASASWAGGDPPIPVQASEQDSPQPPPSGPDMVFCQLYGLAQFGRLADIVGLSVATTSWNIGTAALPWYASPNELHPFIVMNVYRLKTVEGSQRFEQIGQSHIKHGFCALDNTQCGGTCVPTGCSTLNVNCTDTYSSPLNASQGGMAPRYEINPWTRDWNYPGSHFASGGHTHDAIQHRLQVHDADLNPAQNPGATYYSEGFYVCPQDIFQMNSASWKPVTVSGTPGGTWSFGMSGAGTMPTWGFAIDAWSSTTKTILAQQVPVVEFVSPDGRCVLAARATDLGDGLWHYEYAVLNVDMDRQAGSFRIPLPPGVTVNNVGFHAVEHHNEPINAVGGVPIDNAPWTSNLIADVEITWSTTTNPIRWGTMYNFRFDADAEPGEVTATLGLFKPGTPTSVSGTTVGPTACNPALCDDGNLCTDDGGCGPAACTHAYNANPCDDADECTADDTCLQGACVGTALVILHGDIWPEGGDGRVDVDDLMQMVLAFGIIPVDPDADIYPCPPDQDGNVDVDDIMAIVAAYGFIPLCTDPCPLQ